MSFVNRAFLITAPCRRGAIVSNFAWSENTRAGQLILNLNRQDDEN